MLNESFTIVKHGEHWRAGEDVEQIGIIQQDLVDVPGAVFKEVRR